MQRFSSSLSTVLISSCALASLTAGQVRYRPTETGPWRPWSFTAIASVRQASGATAADVQAFEKRLQELAAIVKRAPGVATPIGFAGELFGSLLSASEASPPPKRSAPLVGALSFGAFPLIEFERGGRKVNEDLKGGETELLQFSVNQIDGSMYGTSRPGGWGSAQVDAFVEPASGPPVAGLIRAGDVFVVKQNPKPLWVPFALADALQPVLDDRRALYEQRRDEYQKALAEFTDWQTPAKRAARRADWRQSAATMPGGGAEFLANMEKSDPQIEAATRARLAPGGPDDKGVRDAERDFREAESALAALSPEGRRAPSCYDGNAQRLADRFRQKEGAPASCRALVTPNRDYFDARLPRTAPQVLMIASFTRCLTRESMAATIRGGCVVNRALVDSMDWDAVRAWLGH
jgi:hypothetical protein